MQHSSLDTLTHSSLYSMLLICSSTGGHQNIVCLSTCLPICLVCPQDFEDVSSSQLKKLKKIFQREQFKEAERKKKEVCHV